MNANEARIFRGAYHDSAVLMQLQQALLAQNGVQEAGAVMATPANKILLREAGLHTEQMQTAQADDLLVVVKAESRPAAIRALNQVQDILVRQQSRAAGEYRPKSLAYALNLRPAARWVLVSVPGEYAAAVARRALDLERNVFLYSDNVPLSEELDLKRQARKQNLIVMGPDCGTAMIEGIGLGFANRVRRGPVGLVGASGTGLQQMASLLHAYGTGVSQVFGCGGRDLSADIGGITTLQCLDRMESDPETLVRVLVSKPPDPQIAQRIMAHLASQHTPTIVLFLGQSPQPNPSFSPAQTVWQAHSLDHAAVLACSRLAWRNVPETRPAAGEPPLPKGRKWLRGLFAGGTLASETAILLARHGLAVASHMDQDHAPAAPRVPAQEGHGIWDLGADEFTRGRLHPMQDNQLRIQHLLQAARHPETAIILFDLVLGYGAHADPATEFAQAIRSFQSEPADSRPQFLAVVIGTDADPQGLARQTVILEEAGVQVFSRITPCVQYLLATLEPGIPAHPEGHAPGPEFACINVGLTAFADSVRDQGGTVLQMDWSPPPQPSIALQDMLARMR